MADEGTIRSFNPNITKSLLEIRQQFQRLYTLVPPSAYAATRDPVSTDDISKGWRIGSRWFTNNNVLWECTNNTVSDAVWVRVFATQSGSGLPPSGVAGDADLFAPDDLLGIYDVSLGTHVRATIEDVVIAGGGGGGGGGAPATATYITQTPDGTLSSEQALSLLPTTGLLKCVTGTGVLSIALASDLPAHTHTLSEVTGAVRHETHITRIAPGIDILV